MIIKAKVKINSIINLYSNNYKIVVIIIINKEVITILKLLKKKMK